MLKPGMLVIGIGAWLGTIMLFNVWVLIWPNQKKILGLGEKQASDEEKAKAKTVALMASRTNTLLSIPMIMCMVGMGHGTAFLKSAQQELFTTATLQRWCCRCFFKMLLQCLIPLP